ncbi:hypothetical protein AB0D86_48465 [Streptomyces sp. NPDC048324]|uniref:hypothetical protein n=1 Tax=Streptomyces sp. NPDC048324 TaxID=3157205 RepID=UPI0034227E19
MSRDHPQLESQLTAADRLAIQAAVHTLGRLLNRSLFPDDRCGGVRTWPSRSSRAALARHGHRHDD